MKKSAHSIRVVSRLLASIRTSVTLCGELGEPEKPGNDQNRQPIIELMLNLPAEFVG